MDRVIAAACGDTRARARENGERRVDGCRACERHSASISGSETTLVDGRRLPLIELIAGERRRRSLAVATNGLCGRRVAAAS